MSGRPRLRFVSALLGTGALAATTFGSMSGFRPADDPTPSLGAPPTADAETIALLQGLAGLDRANLGLPVPPELAPRVGYWMSRFVSDQRRSFESGLAGSGLYAELIRERIRARGMPEDLVYLAMMESGFIPRATSTASAVGVWQIMAATAVEQGLRVDEWVDERRDPVRATDAALEYLEALHDRFGSWYLAAAAYNAGPTRVAREVRRHRGKGLTEQEMYWHVASRLPLETREYLPRILAARALASDPERYGLVTPAMMPYRVEHVMVPGRTSLARVAATMGVELSLLRDLNPHFVKGVTPPGGAYPVRVPVGSSAQVAAALSPGQRADPTA